MNIARQIFLSWLVVCLSASATLAQNARALPALDTTQIVGQLVQRNKDRAALLKHYEGCRYYSIRYTGFPAQKSAEMVVEVDFEAPAKKEFRIVRQSGSGLLVSRVLKELLEREKEAQNEQNRSKTAVTPDNYEFQLVGTDTMNGRSQYVLQVTPRTKYKYLYRGKIWVDGVDFAVSRISGEPAGNPSFWISHTEIEHEYKKVGDFWLPASNLSITKVRLGGSAKLNIEYLDYHLGPSQNGAAAANCSNVTAEMQVLEKQRQSR